MYVSKKQLKISKLKNNSTGSYEQIINMLKIVFMEKIQQKIIICDGGGRFFSFLWTFWCTFNGNCRYSTYTICLIRNKRNFSCCRS